MSLPAVTSYTHDNFGNTATLEASGTGSTLTLANLVGLTVAMNYATYLNVEALAGGNVNLPDLATINTGPLALSSNGTSSVLNVSTLTTFSAASGSWEPSLLQANNSGTIQDAALTSLAGVSLPLDGVSTVSVNQISSFTGGTLTVGGGTFTLGSLADLNDSSVTVQAGASLSLPAVTSYAHDNYGSADTLEATGMGSTLTLAHLTGLTVATNYATYLNVEALAGGNVSLPVLATIDTGPLALISNGASSLLDASALTTFSTASGSWTSSLLQATTGGTVYVGQVPGPSAQGVLIDTGGQVMFGGNVQINGPLGNSGSITIGGTLNVTGTYTQATGATLVEQIGGTQAGQFGSLTVTQAAALAGTLDVDLTGKFQPNQGSSTPFLSAASVTGQFSSVVNFTPGSADTFGANYSSTVVNVVATAVVFPDLVVGTVSAGYGGVRPGDHGLLDRREPGIRDRHRQLG